MRERHASSAAVGMLSVGVDIGGTHTDLCVADATAITRAKVLTSHDDYSRAILEAVAVAASERGASTRELLERVGSIVVGTTIVTNSVTEQRGARVGVLTTRGFRDTFRLLGGARLNVYDDHLQVNPPDLTARSLIVEVDERIGRDGQVLVPLNEQGVRDAVEALRDGGAEVLSICFLWSFLNEVHERRAAALAAEVWPDVFVTRSSEVHPVIREYERFAGALLNSFCQPPVELLLTRIVSALRDAGFQGRLSLVSGAGGAIASDTARRFPIALLGSGPAAGVTAATALASEVGESNVLAGDMGGTSFDTCVVRDGAPSISSRIRIAGIDTGLRLVEVISIGTGGGSIASLDERGVPRVGPRSAGSHPGPACYGRGGVAPTVTDAAMILGLIDPGRYLGGRVALDAHAAEQAITSVFRGEDLWTATDAALGIVELTVTDMAHALRSVTVERGHDPREFLMVAYGGMLPMFVTAICDRLGVARAVVPRHSSAFSALGTLLSDYVRRYSLTVGWDLTDPDGHVGAERRRKELRRSALEDARAEGLVDAEISFEWGAECRFAGQVYEVEIPITPDSFGPSSAGELASTFRDQYEVMYGKGTAWPGAGVTVVNITLNVRGVRPKPTFPRQMLQEVDVSAAQVGTRRARLLGEPSSIDVAVYREADLAPGAEIVGPAIVDQGDSTLVIGRSWRARRDELFNFVLTTDAAAGDGGSRA